MQTSTFIGALLASASMANAGGGVVELDAFFANPSEKSLTRTQLENSLSAYKDNAIGKTIAYPGLATDKSPRLLYQDSANAEETGNKIKAVGFYEIPKDWKLK